MANLNVEKIPPFNTYGTSYWTVSGSGGSVRELVAPYTRVALCVSLTVDVLIERVFTILCALQHYVFR